MKASDYALLGLWDVDTQGRPIPTGLFGSHQSGWNMRYEFANAIWKGRRATCHRDGSALQFSDDLGQLGRIEIPAFLCFYVASQFDAKVFDASDELIATIRAVVRFGICRSVDITFQSGSKLSFYYPRRRDWLDIEDLPTDYAGEVTSLAASLSGSLEADLEASCYRLPQFMKSWEGNTSLLFERYVPTPTSAPLFQSPIPDFIDDRLASLLTLSALRFLLWDKPNW